MSGEGWKRKDDEFNKFVECDGEVAVRTKICQEEGEVINVSENCCVTPIITNKSITTANVEESHSFQTGVKKFIIRARDNSKLQIAFNSGDSGSTFVTIPRGNAFTQEGLNPSSLVLYVQSDKSGSIVEILEWT
jgi:hypothetical protein